jgi:DNA-binding transcriptional ArsR family regulator
VTTYQNGFSALADPTRRQIFERVARRPQPVGELAEGLPVSRPAVSQHLRVLRDAGLVVSTRDGSRRLYRVDPRGVAGMRSYLDRFWIDALAAFEDAARAEEDR